MTTTTSTTGAAGRAHAAHRLSHTLARAAVADTTTTGQIRRIEGLCVPYDTPTNLGPYTETIRPGAFAASIRAAANGLPLLALHDNQNLDTLIGKSDGFTETRAGLIGAWTINDTPAAQAAARLVRDGGLGYLSIGFQPVDTAERWVRDQHGETLHLDVIAGRLLEVSLVATPAYALAAVTSVRHLTTADTTSPADPAEPLTPRTASHWRTWLDALPHYPTPHRRHRRP